MPTTPPVGGETPVIPLAISNISATLSSGSSSSYNKSNNIVTLTGASTAQLTNITLTAQKLGFTIKLKSLTGLNGVTLLSNVTSIVVNIKQITGNKPWGDITFDDLSDHSIGFKTADKTYQLKFVK